MNFKQYRVLHEIAHKNIEELNLSSVKLPWKEVFGDKLRIRVDFSPDYSFLNIDDIVYDKEAQAFFKLKDTRKKNPIKLGKITAKHKTDLLKKRELDLEEQSKMVSEWMAKFPEEMKVVENAFIKMAPRIKELRDIFSYDPLPTLVRKYGMTKILVPLMVHVSDVQEILNWLEEQYDFDFLEGRIFSSQLKDVENLQNSPQKYSVIISRAPIDVLRASDFKNILSCLSVGGIHHSDLCENVRIGSGIAYILPELNISDEDLQKPEIFKDIDRAVQGVIPSARVKIRRFTNRDNEELMIPEVRVFGSLAEGMKKIAYAYIVNTLKRIQDITHVTPEEWTLQGSKYIDNELSPSSLIKYFNSID